MYALLLLALAASPPGIQAGVAELGKATARNYDPAMFAGGNVQKLASRRQELQSGLCPTLEGFELHAQQDPIDRKTDVTSRCYVMSYVNITEAWEKCSRDSSCLSFSLFAGSGDDGYCLNYKAGGIFIDRSDSYMPLTGCYGTYVQVNCLAAPQGFTFYKSNVPAIWYDIDQAVACDQPAGKTMSQVVATCQQQNPTCKSFSIFDFDGTGDQAYCFNVSGPLAPVLDRYLPAGKCYGSYMPSTPSIPWLQQWGGQIMADPVNVYMIYVGGYTSSDKVPTTLNHFVSNVGSSDWWRVVPRYYQGPDGSRTFANGALTLAGSYNIPSTSPMGLAGQEIHADVYASIKYAINNNLVPWDPKQGLYVVVTKAGQYDSLPSCEKATACGWHLFGSAFTTDPKWSQMKFAFVPDANCFVGCSPVNDPTGAGSFVSTTYTNLTSPTGSDYVDGLVSTLAHELLEAVTDPFGDAWQTVEGGSGENGDVCANSAYKPSTFTYLNGRQVFYNALVGGKPYLVQLTYDPTEVTGSSPAKQYACVYGVTSSGVPMTLDKPLPSLTEGSLPPSVSLAPPSSRAPPPSSSATAMPTPSMLLWACMACMAAAVSIMSRS